jgi:hypothetical protein
MRERKSAKVIVAVGNEPLERTEDSQNSEGLNGLSVSNSIRRRASLILNEKQIVTGAKSGCNYDFSNRCIRGPNVQWCERRTSSLTRGEAAYSIVGRRSNQ